MIKQNRYFKLKKLFYFFVSIAIINTIIFFTLGVSNLGLVLSSLFYFFFNEILVFFVFMFMYYYNEIESLKMEIKELRNIKKSDNRKRK